MSAVTQQSRAVAFFDGQNLFHAAREAFGYTFPNYNPIKLAGAVYAQQGWMLQETRFCTGIPDATDNIFWNHFWQAKVASLGRRGAKTFTRPLRYRNKTIQLPGDSTHISSGSE